MWCCVPLSAHWVTTPISCIWTVLPVYRTGAFLDTFHHPWDWAVVEAMCNLMVYFSRQRRDHGRELMTRPTAVAWVQLKNTCFYLVAWHQDTMLICNSYSKVHFIVKECLWNGFCRPVLLKLICQSINQCPVDIKIPSSRGCPLQVDLRGSKVKSNKY